MGKPQRVLTVDQLRGELQKHVPESDWQEELIRRAWSRGVYVRHVPSNVVRCPRCSGMIYRNISKGWVDLILINPRAPTSGRSKRTLLDRSALAGPRSWTCFGDAGFLTGMPSTTGSFWRRTVLTSRRHRPPEWWSRRPGPASGPATDGKIVSARPPTRPAGASPYARLPEPAARWPPGCPPVHWRNVAACALSRH